MVTRSAQRALAAATVLGGVFLAEGIAQAGPAEDREHCASAAEQAQQLRDEGKYRRAREQMLVCARDVCPAHIKADCGRWLTDLEPIAPTVVFGARDAKGADVLDVKVSMDGQPIQERLDGKPVLVDSGEHTFKFEAKDGSVKEERVLLRAAEKARPIIVTFGSAAAPLAQPGPTAPAQDDRSQSWIVPTAIVGGIGVLALGSFAVFGLSGRGDVDDLEDSGCRPNCNKDDVDSARTKLIIADVSLGVGVVALGVAAYMFFTRPKTETSVKAAVAKPRSFASSLRVDARGLPGGAFAGVSAPF